MTPKMISCLADAAASQAHRGLERLGGAGGWWPSFPGEARSYRTITVQALVDRGYLQLWSFGNVAHVTDAGQAWLEDWREHGRRAVRRASTAA